LTQVRVLEGTTLLATHTRSFDRAQQIEDPAHVQALVQFKARARVARAQDRLHYAAPSAAQLFRRAAARGASMAVLTRGLLRLLDSHGASALQAAIIAALAEDSAHLGAVRHFIDAHALARGQGAPIPVALPDDPRLRTLHVRPHNLLDYEHLYLESNHDTHRCEQTLADPEHPSPAPPNTPSEPDEPAQS
jgi:hypothetical protein